MLGPSQKCQKFAKLSMALNRAPNAHNIPQLPLLCRSHQRPQTCSRRHTDVAPHMMLHLSSDCILSATRQEPPDYQELRCEGETRLMRSTAQTQGAWTTLELGCLQKCYWEHGAKLGPAAHHAGWCLTQIHAGTRVLLSSCSLEPLRPKQVWLFTSWAFGVAWYMYEYLLFGVRTSCPEQLPDVALSNPATFPVKTTVRRLRRK